MKILINMRTGAMMLMLILLSGTSAWADVDDHLLSVRYVTHTTNTIEFDLYLLDADNAQPYEFAALQLGLLLNSSIYGAGVLTVSYSNLGSGLDPDQLFVNSPDVVAPLAGYAGKTLIRLMANSIPPVPPGAGSGTVISSAGNGTLLAHFTITSSVSFTPNSRAGMEFCAGDAVSPLYPTVVYSYIDGNSTALPVTPGVDAIVDGDPLLNPTLPAVFNVTGTGTYCQGGAGLPVNLSGSELNTTYDLFRDGDLVATLPGTGSTLTFLNQTEGTYTVFATNAAGTIQMTGQAVITAVINTVSPPSSTPTLCINTALTAITHSTTGATGIGTPTGLPAGVTAGWASSTITISGTPTASGIFAYSIPLTGGCGSVNATGTITVTPANTASVASSTPTLCIGTVLTAINHTTTGATGIGAATGLPAGVTAAWASNTITITGTPTASGIFNYSIPLTGGCGSVNATGTITVTPANTAGVASATPTLCINTALTAITHTTTGATGIGTSTGLPAGVTAAWAANTITITGTPTASGIFNYSIPLTGGCGSVNATGTITVTPANTAGVASSTPTLCIGTALTAITHTTTGATGIGTSTGLPSGVTAAWAANTITITGTPTASGIFNYTIPLTGGCGTVNATGTITVTPANTAGIASSTPTLCIGTALTAITHTTTGATGIGAATGLPAGVSTNWAANTITITGTPTASGIFNYTIPLTGGCGSVNATGTITVTPANTASVASSTPTLCIGEALTAITHATTGATGIGTATGLPAGVSANWAANTITITGTPTASGIFNYTIPLTGGCGTVNATGTITVTPANTAGVASSTPTLCIGTALTAITHTTTGATGIGAATGLPAGVTAGWASNAITISGTPTASGIFNYSIPLTGGCGTVNANGTITVTATNTVGAASSTPTLCINSALTPITHATTGATGVGVTTGLPTGVTASLAGNTLTISGTPTASGTFNYSIPLTGGCGTVNATGTITVTAANTVGAASSTPTLCINSALTQITHATTGATGVGVATGLPAGVTASLAGNTLTISGTPTASGIFNYSIPLTGGCGSVNATGTITVTPANAAGIASSTPTLCIGTALTAITHTTTGATGIGAATGLPAGVSTNWAANTITITGTPTASGIFNYTIPLTGGCGSVNATGTITVTPANTASVASSTPTLCIGAALTAITHATTGATGIGTATGLPAGVSANWAANTITITGTPTASGIFNYTIPLTGGCGTVNATGTITVTPANTAGIASSTPTLCIGTALTAITHTTTGATGIGAATGLPAGVTAAWASNTITISGTPAASGIFNYSIPLTGGCGSVNATGTITVTPANTAGVASSTPTLCIGTVLTPITHTTTGATGIGAPSNLPTGVSAVWASNTLTISGTPTVSGTFNYSIPLTGGCSSVSATGTITVTPANTVGAASTAPTLCINTALTAITHTTTGATGIGTATGLPAGVTASLAGNTLTISGTPTASGIFNYSIPLTGGCGSVSATGTITVTANNTVGAASTTPTLCVNTGLTPITHATTGATGIGVTTGLPAGVTTSLAGNTLTISGTPTASGTFNYSIPLTGGCGSVSATGTITVTANNTVGAASTTPTLCINTALTPITHVTTGATGTGVATGLPAGVTASLAGNTLTISGTPTASGIFNYSIPLTGGCGSVSATGTITVTSNNTVGAASTTPTLCINTALTPITHATTGATGIGTPTGLPAGVTASLAGNTLTISGTPTASGIFNYSIPLTGGCGTVNATGTITVSATNTVGAASTTPTLCVNTALTPVTHTTTGATGIGVPSNLPAGVTASWAANTITISGTPTASGTFNYSIPLTGGCGTVNATGTITVSATNTVSVASSSPNLCINTALSPVTHTTTGATGIGVPSNLPAGVTASWAANIITISGTPSAAGTFNYTIPLAGGCGSINATGTITVRATNTVSVASSTPTLCVNTALTSITHTTSGATGIGTATGLPAGVTASWAANIISITGTPTASGTFSYSIPLTGGCGTVNATGTITVTPANTIALTSGVGTNNQTVCNGTAITNITYSTTGATGATITGLPTGVTGSWSGGVVTISGTPSATGAFGYTVTLTGGCGAIPTNGTINVSALPVTSVITGSATPACSATGVAYSVTPTAGSTYTWTVPAGATVATGQGTNSITVNFGTTNGNVAVTERNAAGCNGTPRTLAISLQGCGLDANFAGDQLAICIGSSVTFTNTSTGTTGSTTYSWNFGAGATPASITGIGPHTVTYSTTGAKTVSLTITEGASNTETKTGYITVNPINTINRTSAVGTDNQTVCINTAISNITYSTTGATGATFSGFPSGLTVGWSSNTVTISGTPSTAGTYNYTITLTGGCGNISTGGTINVSANNTAGSASSTPTVCINTAMAPVTHLTTGATGIGSATGLPAGVTASWAASTITISGTPTASGIFTYSIPLTGGCGTVNATGTITVAATNTVGAASSSPNLCINTALTPVTHTTTGATGIGVPSNLPAGVTASWAANIITISGTPSAAGIFNYTIPLAGGCGSINATGTITVRATNTVSVASSTPTLCINTLLTSITHTTSGATGIGTATGLPAGVTANWAANIISITGTPTASGTFSYSIPLTGGCGTVNATGTITVTPANTIALTSGVGTNNQTVCNGTAITNITYSTTGATGATITGLPTGVTGSWSGGVVTISGTPSATGAFGYTVTLTGGCGAIPTNGTINVSALPVTSVITGSATPACSATGVAYSVTPTAGSTYTWTVPAGATVATGQGANSITVNFGTTNGNVAVTERNAAGCNGTPRTLAISLQGCGLSADFSANPRSVCIGSAVSFTNLSTGTTGGTTYSWNFGSGANPLTITGPGPHSVTYSTSGSKDVTLTITDGASDVETKSGYITVNPTNTIILTSGVGSNNQTICVNAPIGNITYSTTGATGATFSGLPAGVTGIWSANVVTISGTPTTDGIYNYSVTLTGGCGNVGASGTITVNVCFKTLTLSSVFLEGLYNGSGVMRQSYDEFGPRWPAGIADQINVELHNSSNYSTIVFTAADVELSTAGSVIVTIPAEYSGSYYITVRNRNHIETTTSLPVSFSNATIAYSFDSASKAFGANLKRIDEAVDHFVIYGGDSNSDGVADGLDLIGIENGATLFSSGYIPNDLNGDGIVDALDLILVENNALNFVMIILP